MRFLILFLFFSIGVSLANNNYAQNTLISIDVQNKTIAEILENVEQQSEFSFIYDSRKVDMQRKLTVHIENENIFEVLNQMFFDTDVAYTVINKKIVLNKSEETLIAAQVITVSGTVTDNAGEALPGVNIKVKGTTIGTSTDVGGKFSLSVPSEDAIVEFSYIGFATQEITVGSRRSFDIMMVEISKEIDEVVVVGYGTQKKINLTGAVDVISSDRLADRQSSTISQMLQGAAPGFDFTINNQGGFQPGATMQMTIRGMGSLNGGAPYILIDGFPGDINNLNPEDVESISVLKDAASSAIYGARAPYGVVLVTTKRGKRVEKISVTYSGNVMINTPQKLPTPLDSHTWTRILNEAGDNMGGRPFSDITIDRVIAFQKQDWNFLRQSMPNWPEGATIFGAYPEGNIWNNSNLNYANTNWWDIYYGHAVNQRHNLSVQGGTNKANYYFSAGYIEQNGVLNFGKDAFSRVNVLGKINLAITDWWDFGWESRFAKKYREMPNMTSESSGTNDGSYAFMFRHISRNYPITPLYDGWGNYMFESHIPSIQAGTDRTDDFDAWNNFKMEIRPLKGWKINGDFAYNYFAAMFSGGQRYIMIHNVDQTVTPNGVSIPNSIDRRNTQNWYWTTNVYTSYTIDINKAHNFMVMAGLQFEKGMNTWLNGFKTDVLVESIRSLQTAVGSPVITERLRHNATQGYFARFAYNFNERYLFESNMRYDGSYVFRDGNRWGFFPSFSVGWNVHRESFWEGISKYVNTFRLKGSWGQLGNQNVDPYSDLELIPMESGKLGWIFNYGQPRTTGYTTAPSIVNQNLTWETVSTTNVGTEASFLNNRLQATFDWFERNTRDMVGPSEAKPGVLGANVPSANNSTLRTRGWELSLSWKQLLNNGLSYFINANLYDYKSVVTQYNNPTGTLSTWYVGKEAGEIWGYQVKDLFRNQAELDEYRSKVDLSFISSTWRPGDVKYEDSNGDGKVNNGLNTVNDPGDLSIIGNSEPHYMYGFSLGAGYKGIDFSMLWRGVAKKDIYFYNGANIFWGFTSGWWESVLTPDHLDYFRDSPGTIYSGLYEGDANINTNAYWPRPYLNGTQEAKNKNNANTRYMTTGAYLRLQNVQIGYSIPKNLISKANIEKVRVYFAGENLLTFSKLPDGLDPVAPVGFPTGGSFYGTQGTGRLTYGADRIYSFGITVTY